MEFPSTTDRILSSGDEGEQPQPSTASTPSPTQPNAPTDPEVFQGLANILNTGIYPSSWPRESRPGVTWMALLPGQEPELAAGEKAERSGNPTVAYSSSNSKNLLLKEYISLQHVGTRVPTGRTLQRLFLAEEVRGAVEGDRKKDLPEDMVMADGKQKARYICRVAPEVPSVWKFQRSKGRKRAAPNPAQPSQQPQQRAPTRQRPAPQQTPQTRQQQQLQQQPQPQPLPAPQPQQQLQPPFWPQQQVQPFQVPQPEQQPRPPFWPQPQQQQAFLFSPPAVPGLALPFHLPATQAMGPLTALMQGTVASQGTPAPQLFNQQQQQQQQHLSSAALGAQLPPAPSPTPQAHSLPAVHDQTAAAAAAAAAATIPQPNPASAAAAPVSAAPAQQQQHTPIPPEVLDALHPPGISPQSQYSGLQPLAHRLLSLLQQHQPATVLAWRLMGRDTTAIKPKYAHLGHIAVAPSRATAEGGLAEGSAATTPELWSVMVLCTFRLFLGQDGFEKLLTQRDGRRNNPLHWACRYQRLSAIAWLLGLLPPGLPADDPFLRPHQPSIAMLSQYSKSGWLPLHSLLREAGERQLQLPELQANKQAESQHIITQLLQLCKCWIQAVEEQKPGLISAGQLLRHPTAALYWEFGCDKLLEGVCEELHSELGFDFGKPTAYPSKGELGDLELQVSLAAMSLKTVSQAS